jgi:predicted TIM-barrel fold metal-dependent hydrolase
MTNANETPVVDFGSHFHVEEMEPVDGPSDHVDDVDTDPERFLEWFKKGGVDNVVLSETYKVGVDDIETGRQFNDELLDVVNEFEDYYGLATIPVGAGGEPAAAEFERCLDAGFNGGFIWSTIEGKDFTNQIFEPVWEVADAYGAPILVHPTSTSILKRDYPDEHVLEPVYNINHAFGREALMCGSISKVINSGLLEEYPDMKLVYHHYGGNIASHIGRVQLRQTRSTQDEEEYEGTTVSWPEYKDQLENRIYIDTSGHHTHSGPLRMALEQFPASNILLGTDASSEPKTPAELNRHITNVRDAAPREEARQILGQNALDIMINT